MMAAVVVTLVVSNSDLTGLYGAIAAGWLAIHQVPLTIGHSSLGILPLVPTLAMMWTVAVHCAHATEPDDSLRDIGRLLGLALAIPLLMTLIALAVIDDAVGIIALAAPNPLVALAWVLAIHLIAALSGIAYRLRDRLPELPLPGWVLAVPPAVSAALRRLFGFACVLTVASLIWHWSRIGAAIQSCNGHSCDGVAGIVGLSVLSLVYLPNVVVGALAVLVGGGVHVGSALIGVFGVVDGPRPPVPVLAAVPGGPSAGWWAVLLLFPVYVAVVLGRECARRCLGRAEAIQATAIAAAVITAILTAIALIAGGELGSFGFVGVSALLFGLLVFGWMMVLGCVSASFARTGLLVEEPLGAEPAE